MSIPIFVPSKDRPAQLHLLLESTQKNAPGLFSPEVMFCTSNNDYYEGYMKCFDHFPQVRFHHEECAQKSFYEFLNRHATNNSCVGLFTDDCILYRPLKMSDVHIENCLRDEVWCVSLRLGLNITITDYVTNKPCPQPNDVTNIDFLDINNKVIDNGIKWNYRQFPDKFASYFGFPTAFDGCFYQANDLIWLANNGEFSSIILWEHMICNNDLQNKTPKDKLVCPMLSNVVVQNINSSHSYGHRSNNHFNRSLSDLNENYLAGRVIDLDKMDFSGVNCAHAEIPFTFKESN